MLTVTNRKGEYRIAWGFLKPVSASGRSNSEKSLRVRLFEYPRTMPKVSLDSVTKPFRRNAPNVPEPKQEVEDVFKLYLARSKAKLYPSTLYVELRAIVSYFKSHI